MLPDTNSLSGTSLTSLFSNSNPFVHSVADIASIESPAISHYNTPKCNRTYLITMTNGCGVLLCVSLRGGGRREGDEGVAVWLYWGDLIMGDGGFGRRDSEEGFDRLDSAQ